MKRRQRAKIIPQQWIIAECKEIEQERYTLYALDFQHQGRFSWSGWHRLQELLQFRIPVRSKTGSLRTRYQPCAKIAGKAIWLSLDQEQYEQLERLLYQPVSRRRWRRFLQHLELPYGTGLSFTGDSQI